MSTANIDGLINAAIQAHRAGNKVEARQLLERATDLDPMNEKGWMWLSAVVETPEDQKICLENVIYINPNNNDAKRGLRILEEKFPQLWQETDADAPAPTTPDADPYYVPTSSISGVPNPAEQISSNELDDWIGGMFSGSTGDTAAPKHAPAPHLPEIDDNAFADVFELDDMRQDLLEDDDDDDGPEFTGISSSSSPAFNPATSFSGSMFGFDEDSEDLFSPASAPTPAPSVPPANFGLDPDPFGDGSDVSAPPRERLQSPMEKRPTKAASRPMDDDDDRPEPDPGEYFRAIPKEIKATRLPGVEERYSPLVIPAIVLLLILNIGAAAFLLINLMG